MVFEESVVLDLPFDEALVRTKEAFAAQGFGVLTEIDVQATLKAKVDKDMGRYVIVGACNPGLAAQALDAEPLIGVLLPCNVVVRETDPRCRGRRHGPRRHGHPHRHRRRGARRRGGPAPRQRRPRRPDGDALTACRQPSRSRTTSAMSRAVRSASSFQERAAPSAAVSDTTFTSSHGTPAAWHARATA